MNIEMRTLQFKLVVIKEMLEEMQQNLDVTYQVEDTLQEIINMTGEAIIENAVILRGAEPLHSAPVSGNKFIASPEV